MTLPRSLRRLLATLMLCVLPASAFAQAPLVVTTHSVLLDIIRQIGGGEVRAETLVPPGVSTRDFDPTEDTARSLQDAALLVVHGLDFDAWIDGVVRDAGYRGDIAIATDRLPLLDLEGRIYEPEDEPELDFSQFDPHVWHDPRNVIHAARIVAVALSDILPAHARTFDERLQAYVRELEEVHAYAERSFAALPAERRRIATSHDVFAYLGHAYDLQIGLIPGFEPGRTPPAAQLARMIALVRSMNVPAIFLAAGTAPTAVNQIEQETGVRVITTLFTESLGSPGSPEGSYVIRFRRNVDEIIGALR